MAKAIAEKSKRLNREDWIEAAMTALAEEGIDGIRVEALAKRLHVTKGGFYWHFKGRGDLVAAVLDRWRSGRIDAITQQVSPRGRAPEEVLKELLDRYADSKNKKGNAIELALRDWARRDKGAERVVSEVDASRLEQVASLFLGLGCEPDIAYARAYLYYAYVFGQSLLVEMPGESNHAAAREVCMRLLVERATD